MTKNTSTTMTRRIGSTVFKVNIFTKEESGYDGGQNFTANPA